MTTASQVSDLLLCETVVSAPWVASTYNVSVHQATALLQQVQKQQGNAVHASYLVRGLKDNGDYTFAVVSEAVLEEQKSKLREPQVSVYSLQAVPSSSTDAFVSDSLLQLVQTQLQMGSNEYLHNSTGSVSLPGLVVKPVGERALSSVVHSLPTLASSAARPASASGSSAATAVRSSAASVSTEQKKNVAKAQSFFGKPATTTSVITEKPPAATEHHDVKAITETPTTSSELEPLQPAKKTKKLIKKSTAHEEDEEFFDEGTVGIKRPSRESDDTSSNAPMVGVNAAPEITVVEVKEEAAHKAKGPKPRDATVRGALDDYMEDVAIEQFKKEQQHTGNTLPPTKKTKRVLVEKSSIDDRGYFVTESVWEEITDDESAAPLKPAPVISKPIEKKPVAASAAATGKAKPSTGTQKSLASFFGKK